MKVESKSIKWTLTAVAAAAVLAAVSCKGMKEEGRNPFGLIEIENGGITGEEIENLSYGMERERKLGLTYVKTNSK